MRRAIGHQRGTRTCGARVILQLARRRGNKRVRRMRRIKAGQTLFPARSGCAFTRLLKRAARCVIGADVVTLASDTLFIRLFEYKR